MFKPGRHGFGDYAAPLSLEADVCIVGAGAGGCAAAAALAESGLRVVLLEEGSHWEPADFKQDTAFALKNLYQDRGARTLRGNTIIPMPGGRGVGGSTLINSGICFRCPEPVLESWRDTHGCDTVTSERFGEYFDRIWATLGVSVNPVSVQRNNNLIFRQGAEALGLGGEFMARSAPGCVGCGICQYGCPTGGKASADRTFLRQALATGNVAVYADCRAVRCDTAGDRIVRVEGHTVDPRTHEAGVGVTVRADTYLLSGGPVGTPLFLLRNGLADSQHCGAHLVVHPAVGALATFEQEIRPWTGVTQGYYVDRWAEGFLLQTYTVSPDQYFLLLQTPPGPETLALMANLAHVASAGVLVHDEDSEGRVRWTPAGPDLSYFLGDVDRSRLIAGLKLCAEVFFAAGARQVSPGRLGASPVSTMDEVRALLPGELPAHLMPIYASHPMGTCRMGADPELSVVDPHGRVWGWANLRVADASVFPSSLGVNPQVTTMAMGLLVGHSIAGRV
ncbi:MAG: choline dehydrogenase-like flavoprotein [Myxococcota bacterium]|jgi:choline dehydrogenase-like flavoprotein